LLQHAKAGSTDIGSDPVWVYYFAELYSFNVEVSLLSIAILDQHI